MMSDVDYRVHERTLIGGIDSYLGTLVHLRPHLASRQRDQLDALAEQWMDEGGANALDSVTPEWIGRYLALVENPSEMEEALRGFYGWAIREALTDRSPVPM